MELKSLRMLRYLQLLLPLFIVAGASAEGVAVAKNNLIECKTDFINSPTLGYVINVSIKNVCGRDLAIFEEYLPWISLNHCRLVAIPLNVLKPTIDPIILMGDPTVNYAVIKPGMSLGGEIVLKREFAGFAQIIRKGEIAIFWSFDLQTTEQESLGRYSGYSIIGHSAK